MSFTLTCPLLHCNHKSSYDICTDNTRLCGSCHQPIQGNNSYRSYSERVKYYQNALLECTKYNRFILVESCLIIAKLCADPPRFAVNEVIDYLNLSDHSNTLKHHYAVTEVLAIRYELFEQIAIKNPKYGNERRIWVNAHDETVKKLNIFRPIDTKDTITVLCGKCGCAIYESLAPFQYLIGEPSQPHFSYELFTNIAPKADNVKSMNENETMLNCKNNCHVPLWLIDRGTGYVDRKGYIYALACGRTYTNVRMINKEDCKAMSITTL